MIHSQILLAQASCKRHTLQSLVDFRVISAGGSIGDIIVDCIWIGCTIIACIQIRMGRMMIIHIIRVKQTNNYREGETSNTDHLMSNVYSQVSTSNISKQEELRQEW